MDQEQMRETAQNWRQKAEDWKDRAAEWQQAAKTAALQVDDFVHERAWASLGIAALLGCVIGLLMSRRRD